MPDQFSRLLEPTDFPLFWDRYWTKEYLHVRASHPSRHESVLRIEDIDALFQSEQLSPAFFNLVTDGASHSIEQWSRLRDSARGPERVVDIERILALYLSGATIILNQAHHAIPRLSSLCRELASEMGFGAQANVYITPSGARGFPLHTDNHEVFVLQLHGQKTWRLSPEGCASPIEIELLPGDLLYLPRGLAHQAACRDSPSIHITLGLKPVYAFELLQELAAKARTHPGFQKPVRTAEEFLPPANDLLNESSLAELKERRFHTLVADQIKGWPGRLSGLLALNQVTPETVVCAQAGILHVVTNNGKSIDIEFAGQKISVPAFMRSCLQTIIAREPFAIKELQGLITDSGKVELVKRFLQTGYLSIVRL